MALHSLRMFWKQYLFIGEGRGPSLPGAAWLCGKRVLQWGVIALQYPRQGSRWEWGRCGLLVWVFSVILKLVLLSPCPSVGSAALFCPLPAPCYWQEWGGGAVLELVLELQGHLHSSSFTSLLWGRAGLWSGAVWL